MRGERGFTTISVLIAMALTGLITLGAGMVTVQLCVVPKSSGDIMMAARQVQNVGCAVSEDLLMSQGVVPGDDPATPDDEFVTIDWVDWETGDTHQVRYVQEDSVDSLKMVKRKELSRDKGGAVMVNNSTLIADYISAVGLSLEDDMWKLQVEARSGKRTSARTYEIAPRQ